MNEIFPSGLQAEIKRTGVMAVLVVDDAEDAVPLAHALLAGGVNAMELTLRTPAAVEALRRIRAEVPEMIAGVGTVLTPQQVREVHAAGAAFAVAPGINPRVVREAAAAGLPFAPGICTPTDIEMALEEGCKLLKLFPAEPQGGLAYLKSIAAPYQHLGVSFVPLGGVSAANAADYLASPLVAALGGSWIAPRDLIKAHDWDSITAKAREIIGIVAKARA